MIREQTPAHLKRERCAKFWLVDQIKVWHGYLKDEEILAMYRKEFPDVMTDTQVLAGIKYSRSVYRRHEAEPKRSHCAHCGQVLP